MIYPRQQMREVWLEQQFRLRVRLSKFGELLLGNDSNCVGTVLIRVTATAFSTCRNFLSVPVTHKFGRI